jgi:hypothetical protein
VAKEFGWADLVATTIIRTVELEPGRRVESSLQVIWSDHAPDADIAHFPDEDIWRAAVFDVLIDQSDRWGHNWLAVPAPGGSGTPRLKLCDHGYAFDFPGRALQSTFSSAKNGQEIPPDVRDALSHLASSWPPDGLVGLLESDAESKLEARAKALAAADRLPI